MIITTVGLACNLERESNRLLNKMCVKQNVPDRIVQCDKAVNSAFIWKCLTQEIFLPNMNSVPSIDQIQAHKFEDGLKRNKKKPQKQYGSNNFSC